VTRAFGVSRDLLFGPHRKLGTDKRLNPFRSRQSQAQQGALALQVDVEVKKRAALALRSHPLRQLREGDILRAELKLVTVLRLHRFSAQSHQLVGQLLVTRALRRVQRLDVAVELALRNRLLFRVACRRRRLRFNQNGMSSSEISTSS
jgi:hypothetical protein